MKQFEYILQWTDVSHMSEHDYRAVAKAPTGGSYIVVSDEDDLTMGTFYMDPQMRTVRVGNEATVGAAQRLAQKHLNEMDGALDNFFSALSRLSRDYGVVIAGLPQLQELPLDTVAEYAWSDGFVIHRTMEQN